MQPRWVSSKIAYEQLCAVRSGTVHSVFAHSLNLQLGPNLVHIGFLEDGLCCFGLAAPSPAVEPLLRCQPGDVCAANHGRLTLYHAGAVETVGLAGIELRDLRVPPLPAGAGAAGAAGAMAALLTADQRCGLAAEPALLKAVSALYDAAQGRFSGFEAAADYLIGRGPGLTPSGDDLLTGFAAVQYAQRKALGLAPAILERLGRTTDISAAYLQAALGGQVNEQFKRMLAAIGANDRYAFMRSMRAVAALGHTSGHDTLLGSYIALAASAGMEEEKVLCSCKSISLPG